MTQNDGPIPDDPGHVYKAPLDKLLVADMRDIDSQSASNLSRSDKSEGQQLLRRCFSEEATNSKK